MNLKNKVNIHNRFDIEVRDAKTGLLKKSFTSYNIVLNQMYTRLCGGLSYFANIHFGTSTGTLSATRTSLFSHLGTKAAVDEEIIKAIPLSIWKRKIVLNPEEYVGSTISEVGIAFGSTNTNLVTHSLLKDSEGNPISIVKTNTDVITIYATVFVTFDNGNPNLVYIGMPSSNALVNYLIGGAAAPTGAFSLNDTFLANARLGSTSNVTWTSDTANKQRKTNVLRFGTSVGNGHVKFLEFASVFSLEFPYSSVFNGQSYEGVNLGVGDGVQDVFQVPSANVKNGSLQVKINGVSSLDFSVVEKHRNFRSGRNVANGNRAVMSDDGSAIFGFKSPYSNAYDLFCSNFIDGSWTNVAHNFVRLESGYIPNSIATNSDGSLVVIAYRRAPSSAPNLYAVLRKVGGSYVVQNPSVAQGGYPNNCACSGDGLVFALDATTYHYDGGWVKRPNLPGSVVSVQLNNDGSRVFVVDYYATCSLYEWDGLAWNLLGSIGTSMGNSNSVRSSANNSFTKFLVMTAVSPYTRVVEWNGASLVGVVDGFVFPPDSSNGGCIFGDGSILFCYKMKFYEWNGTNFSYKGEFSTGSYYGGMTKTEDEKLVCVATDPSVLLIPGLPFLFIKFVTPPAIGDVITADYTVDGVHKTDQYVIDVSMAIQFGEVV